MGTAHFAHFDNRRVINDTRKNCLVEHEDLAVFGLLELLLGDHFDGKWIARPVVESDTNLSKGTAAKLLADHVIMDFDALLCPREGRPRFHLPGSLKVTFGKSGTLKSAWGEKS